LDNVAYFFAVEDKRLPPADYSSWDKQEVRTFLEENCGLSLDNRCPGRIIQHHDEAFDFWLELVKLGHIEVPFEVVHIDGHADLGNGDAGYTYLMSELLHLEPADRPLLVDRSQILEGNYLAFAIACRWISKIEYVKHPKSGNDLPSHHFKDYDKQSGFIQLKKLEKGAFHSGFSVKDLPVLKLEPSVPFQAIDCWNFRATHKFDYMVLSKSPRYTPPESDTLVPLIGEYIDPI